MSLNRVAGAPPGAGAQPLGAPGSDTIRPEIRFVGAAIVLVLVVASAILLGVPDRTGDFFAWKITPRMTPLLMGAGYLSGAWFFIRVWFARRWHTVGNGLLAITAFTWFMMLATLLHWNKFTPGHPSFYAWAFLYFVTPFLVPFLWFRNRAADPGMPDSDDAVVPRSVRTVALVVGAALVAIGLFLFLLPDVAIAIWPWKLTPLTARIVAGWFALPGVVGLVVTRDARWSAWRVLLEAQAIGLALILVGVARAWSDFNPTAPTTPAFVGGIALLLIGVVTLYTGMEAARRRAPAGTAHSIA